MHRGVREFIEWVAEHATDESHADLALNPPATVSDVAGLEQMLGGPLPADLRLVLTRFNGGQLPVGQMLPAGLEPGTIGATVREYAEAVELDFLDPELLLPFHRTLEGSLLAFDRSAGPVADTWPIVDYFEDTGEHRLVYRTFDAWCRHCVSEWTSEDFGEDFSLDTYLRAGERHVAVSPDVATPHATVAHALKRAGRPEDAMNAYLLAARCVPPLHWCDWEALKIAAILGEQPAGYEAMSRLSGRAPVSRWTERETTPGRVAEVGAVLAARARDKEPWLRLIGQLEETPGDETEVIAEIRRALVNGEPMPPVRPLREEPRVTPVDDVDAWFASVCEAYTAGLVRDDDLLLDPELVRLGRVRDFARVLCIRRDF